MKGSFTEVQAVFALAYACFVIPHQINQFTSLIKIPHEVHSYARREQNLIQFGNFGSEELIIVFFFFFWEKGFIQINGFTLFQFVVVNLPKRLQLQLFIL